jgi:uncharacterized membrane protein YbhN (UPF0104 family)
MRRPTPDRQIFGRAFIGVAVLIALYVGALAYFDQRSGVFGSMSAIGMAILPVAAISLVAFALRCARWRWLLHRLGSPVPPVPSGLAYLAGFALTASPAKVGELIRIRYFADLGVPPQRIIAAMVFERTSDIVVLLALALFLAEAAGFWLASGFAAVTIVVVLLAMRFARWWPLPAGRLRRAGWRSLARLVRIIGQGILAVRPFFRPLTAAVSLAFGLAIYGLHAAAFVHLAHTMDLALPPAAAIGLYPVATLIGAASMLPGGIGTTEVAMVLLLHGFGVPLDVATVTALAMRLATTWLAIVIGFLCAGLLEWKRKPRAAAAVTPQT